VSLLRSCGGCFYCTTGSPYLCKGEFALNKESRLHNSRGEPIRHGISTAAFAEQVIVDQSQVVRIAEDIPLEEAALLACGVVTGFGAVVNTAKVGVGSSVAVVGVGGVGLNAIQGAAVSGAHPIIAIDLLDSKLEAARIFGATHTVNVNTPEHDSVRKAVRNLTSGRGADYVFVTVGSNAAVEQGIRMACWQGTVVLVGLPAEETTAQLPVSQFVWTEKRVIGSFMGSTRIGVDVSRLIDLYRNGRLKLRELISNRYPLDQINEAIEATESGEALRNMILFSDGERP
jgi:S-(hydroxymethyl)glutathione dehydrogenase/alcohol dehydrogenase